MRSFRYYGDSKDFDWGLIKFMLREAEEVTYRTMRLRAPDLVRWSVKMGYAPDARRGLTLMRDPQVRYYRSTFRGFPCYFLTLDRVHYIWTQPGGP